MKEMVFDSQQKAVTVTHPQQGITDALILKNEKIQKRKDEMNDEEITEYCYNGNNIRLYKDATDDEINENMDTLLEQEQTEKPTDEMMEYASAKIDEFTLQLMEEGVL